MSLAPASEVLYEVLFDWSPENEEDLPLKVGDVIQVLEMKDGWWNGRLLNSEPVIQGFFPSNYVREKMASPPKPPPRPVSSKKAIDDVNSQLTQLALEGEMNSSSSNLTREAGVAFSIESLDAFDELMNRGFAIEYCGGAIQDDKAELCADDSVVEVGLSALCWDGADSKAYPFCNGALGIVVGKGHVCQGLERALRLLPKQIKLEGAQQIRIICSPALAYGEAGNPPLVPPNSNLVFIITSINSIPSSSPSSSSSVVDFSPYGIQELILRSLIPVSRRASMPPSGKRRSIVLVQAGSGGGDEGSK